jgi:hypothetical protein
LRRLCRCDMESGHHVFNDSADHLACQAQIYLFSYLTSVQQFA